jgi:hypothetical protein
MNRISAVTLLAIASLAACGSAIAQQPSIKANIPFDFTVGNTWMPAGEYTVSSPSQHVVQLRSSDNAKTAEIVSTQGYNESRSGSKVVFDKFGDQYFLRHVLCPSIASMNLDVPQGKPEKNARSHSLEAKSHNGEQTMVAAR